MEHHARPYRLVRRGKWAAAPPAEIRSLPLPLMMAQVPLSGLAEGWPRDDTIVAVLALPADVTISDWLVSHWPELAERWMTL